MNKQILIAVDSSATCSLALEYIASLFARQEDVHFLLLHCQASGAEVVPEPEDTRNSLMPDRPISKHHMTGTILLEKARLKLESNGISSERLKCFCQQASNIAAAIQQHAEKNLVDSIVVARFPSTEHRHP
jgi:nucleotide-binding universal stress UspA family protein